MRRIRCLSIVFFAIGCGIWTTTSAQAETGIVSYTLGSWADGWVAETHTIGWSPGEGNPLVLGVPDPTESFGVASLGTVTTPWNHARTFAGVGDPNTTPWRYNVTLNNGSASTIDITNANDPGGPNGVGGLTSRYINTPWAAGQFHWGVGSPAAFIDIGDLNATFTSYSVIAYVTGYDTSGGSGIGNQGQIKLVDPVSENDLTSTHYYQTTGLAGGPDPAVAVEVDDTDPNDGVDIGNYIVFDNLTADAFSIEWETFSGPGTALGGFQIFGELASADVDLDDDGDVDGRDFLLIQRTDPSLIPDWQSQYGTGTLVGALSAVPEPSSLLLLLAGIAAVTVRLRR